MLDIPKGYKYWHYTDSGAVIEKNAPNWAKEEFDEYQKTMNQSGKPNENGIIKYI